VLVGFLLSDESRCLQKCEDDVERLPGEIEAHQARVAQLTEELADAEAEVERLAEAARPEREALTKKQQVGAAVSPGIDS
jgi:predicted  nucleic acid-binding Zn-ribbon protein